jgi:hypothetical protein
MAVFELPLLRNAQKRDKYDSMKKKSKKKQVTIFLLFRAAAHVRHFRQKKCAPPFGSRDLRKGGFRNTKEGGFRLAPVPGHGHLVHAVSVIWGKAVSDIWRKAASCI